MQLDSTQIPSSKIQSSATRPVQCQCNPGIAIADKDLHESHLQLIKPCANFPQMRKTVYKTVYFHWTITIELGLRDWHMEANHHHAIFT